MMNFMRIIRPAYRTHREASQPASLSLGAHASHCSSGAGEDYATRPREVMLIGVMIYAAWPSRAANSVRGVNTLGRQIIIAIISMLDQAERDNRQARKGVVRPPHWRWPV